MHILLTGSTGFIGHTLQAALQRAGHTVHGGVSPRQRTLLPGQVPMDFAHDTTAAAWLPRLQGIDAVVNAVGVLRDTRARPIDAVHRTTPIALFDACAQAGVQRVVHISALGIEGSSVRWRGETPPCTVWPARCSAACRVWPMKPVEPVRRMCMVLRSKAAWSWTIDRFAVSCPVVPCLHPHGFRPSQRTHGRLGGTP